MQTFYNVISRHFASFLATVLLASSGFMVDSAMAHDVPGDSASSDEKLSSWEKSIALGANYSSGNTDSTLVHFSANAATKVQKDKKNIWRFGLDVNWGETDSGEPGPKELNEQNVKQTGEYKRKFGNQRWFAGFHEQAFHDKIAEVDYRFTLGPSIGYFLIHKDTVRLSLEVGPSYVFEKVDDEKDEYLAPRIAERFEWDISKTAKLYQQAEVVFDASDSDNTIVHGEIGLSAALNDHLSLVFKVTDKYDNQPADGEERNDVGVITSLQLNL